MRSQTLPGESKPVIDLRGGVEAIIEELWPRLEKQFECETARRARAAGMKTDTQVFDGNAKNRRLVCRPAQTHDHLSPFGQECLRGMPAQSAPG